MKNNDIKDSLLKSLDYRTHIDFGLYFGFEEHKTQMQDEYKVIVKIQLYSMDVISGEHKENLSIVEILKRYEIEVFQVFDSIKACLEKASGNNVYEVGSHSCIHGNVNEHTDAQYILTHFVDLDVIGLKRKKAEKLLINKGFTTPIDP